METELRQRPMQKQAESTAKDNETEDKQPSIPRTHPCANLEWNQIPEWQKDNEYILTGYRNPSGSYVKSFRSAFAIHNETINIWSHVFGSALFFSLPAIIFNEVLPRYSSAEQADIIVFSTFFFGVAVCFFLSATFHIINNHSAKVAALGNQLDYLGIVILMWGSTIPCVYYGFHCDPQLQKLYWGMVTVLASICTYTTLQSGFRSPSFRAFRSTMYAGLGLSFIIPIIHALSLYGLKVQILRMSLDWMFLMATFNLIGAGIYAARIPEKWHPRKFDIYGSSHQILHFAVIFAGIAHLFGLLRAFDHLHSPGGRCKDVK